MATQTQRDAACEVMDYLYEHREQVHYPPIVNGQIIRQMSIAHVHSFAQVKALVNSSRGLIVDCSQSVTMIVLAVGCKNPNGGPVDGYTGTLLANLPRYSDPREAFPMGLAVFGGGTGHHVVMVRHRDHLHGNPICFSQGSEPDPRYLALLSEAAGQPRPVTMLSVAAL